MSFCQINTCQFYFEGFLNVYRCVPAWVYVYYMCKYPQGPGEGIGLPGTGISNGFALPDVGAGNWIQFSAKEVSILTYWAFYPASAC